jgi:uncharacterized membrane protein YeaQ/YmgE (transglycosylase-associated protein family)
MGIPWRTQGIKEIQEEIGSSVQQLKCIYQNKTMENKQKKSVFSGIPSWALSVFTLMGATIVLFGLGEGLVPAIKAYVNIGESIAYLIFDLIITVCCYFIVKQNPKSIWYVPLICNAVGIIAALIEPTFWKTSLWMLFCGGWALSLIASIIGAKTGKKVNA